MSKNNYFFRNIEQIGDLNIEYIILEMDFPLLFTCRDNDSKLFIVACIDSRGSKRWIVSEVNENIIISLLRNKKTLYETFRGITGQVFLFNWSYEDKKIDVCKVSYDILVEDDKPLKGEYLDDDIEEHDEYIKQLRASEYKYSSAQIINNNSMYVTKRTIQMFSTKSDFGKKNEGYNRKMRIDILMQAIIGKKFLNTTIYEMDNEDSWKVSKEYTRTGVKQHGEICIFRK